MGWTATISPGVDWIQSKTDGHYEAPCDVNANLARADTIQSSRAGSNLLSHILHSMVQAVNGRS